MENRRLKLKDGREVDVRHAYSLPPDDEVAEVGPVDPEIGVLRLDRKDGRTLAVVYNFACHPIQGVPSGGNTADITGFASQVIEDNLSDGTHRPVRAGLRRRHQSRLVQGRRPSRACRAAGQHARPQHAAGGAEDQCKDDSRLDGASTRRSRCRGPTSPSGSTRWKPSRRGCCSRCKGTSLNLKTFLPLVVKYNVSGEFPVVLLAPLPARQGARPRRPEQARRREPQEHRGVHPATSTPWSS